VDVVASNFVRSVYELHGRARVGSDEKGAPERRLCSKNFGSYPVLQLERAATYLKRDGRITHGTVVLRSLGRGAVGLLLRSDHDRFKIFTARTF